MPPVKDEKPSATPLNTTAQIQQIFSEVQLQLPTVNFDDDDQNENDDNEEILESNATENSDALLESLINNNGYSFLTLHPKIETPQQPPSVELQMRVSPNLFDYSSLNQESPPKPSILSMDLFNSIDFDKLPTLTPTHDQSQVTTPVTRTFHRPRPTATNPHFPSTPQQQEQTNLKNRDDRQILERLTQQANTFNNNERTHLTREHQPFRNLESALFSSNKTHSDRHTKRTGIPESERKTVFIDLRNSAIEKQKSIPHEQQFVNVRNPIAQQTQSSDSESDDDRNDGMLWFEKRRQAKTQQQPNTSQE